MQNSTTNTTSCHYFFDTIKKQEHLRHCLRSKGNIPSALLPNEEFVYRIVQIWQETPPEKKENAERIMSGRIASAAREVGLIHWEEVYDSYLAAASLKSDIQFLPEWAQKVAPYRHLSTGGHIDPVVARAGSMLNEMTEQIRLMTRLVTLYPPEAMENVAPEACIALLYAALWLDPAYIHSIESLVCKPNKLLLTTSNGATFIRQRVGRDNGKNVARHIPLSTRAAKYAIQTREIACDYNPSESRGIIKSAFNLDSKKMTRLSRKTQLAYCSHFAPPILSTILHPHGGQLSATIAVRTAFLDGRSPDLSQSERIKRPKIKQADPADVQNVDAGNVLAMMWDDSVASTPHYRDAVSAVAKAFDDLAAELKPSKRKTAGLFAQKQLQRIIKQILEKHPKTPRWFILWLEFFAAKCPGSALRAPYDNWRRYLPWLHNLMTSHGSLEDIPLETWIDTLVGISHSHGSSRREALIQFIIAAGLTKTISESQLRSKSKIEIPKQRRQATILTAQECQQLWPLLDRAQKWMVALALLGARAGEAVWTRPCDLLYFSEEPDMWTLRIRGTKTSAAMREISVLPVAPKQILDWIKGEIGDFSQRSWLNSPKRIVDLINDTTPTFTGWRSIDKDIERVIRPIRRKLEKVANRQICFHDLRRTAITSVVTRITEIGYDIVIQPAALDLNYKDWTCVPHEHASLLLAYHPEHLTALGLSQLARENGIAIAAAIAGHAGLETVVETYCATWPEIAAGIYAAIERDQPGQTLWRNTETHHPIDRLSTKLQNLDMRRGE